MEAGWSEGFGGILGSRDLGCCSLILGEPKRNLPDSGRALGAVGLMGITKGGMDS